jgi:hypothetical protein
MRKVSYAFSIATALAVMSPAAAWAQTIEGVIASDEGGAAGYRHSIERSRFATGSTVEQIRPVEEFGFLKVTGRNGVFATNMRNGLVIATRSDGMDKAGEAPQQYEGKAETVLTPEKHNAMVMDYFTGAGIPRNQVRGIHATTYLSASGPAKDAAALRPKIEGYASVLERVVADKYPVAESVAWARLDNEGKTITEWIYWPAIPAKAIAEARLLEEMMTGSRKDDYLRRLPAKAREGTVVIHHSSATDEGPVEAFATFDVVELLGTSDQDAGKMSKAPSGPAIVRHFDAAGVERRLPSERLSLGATDPASK